jgi:hypothetical protein
MACFPHMATLIVPGGNSPLENSAVDIGFLSDLLHVDSCEPYGWLTMCHVVGIGPSSAEIVVSNSHGGGGRVRIDLKSKGTNGKFLRHLRYRWHFWFVPK